MKTAELKRELVAIGVKLVEGKKHTKAYLIGRQTTIPRHKEIPEQLAKVIKKHLGIS